MVLLILGLCAYARQTSRVHAPSLSSAKETYINRTLSCSHHIIFIDNIMMASVPPKAIAPFCLGVIMHLGFFIRGEWHLRAATIFLAHALVFILLLAKQLVSGLSIWSGVALPFLVYLCGLLVSMATYRLFFHRLTYFPGPRLAALSKLWHVWLCRNSKNHLVLDSWRQKYGTFVRTGQSFPSSEIHLITFTDLSSRSERGDHISSRWTGMVGRTPESKCQI